MMRTGLPRPGSGSRRILVVGGGASGVLLAAQLLRRDEDRVAVTIVEKGAMLGCGVAYSTTDPTHLLNTRVANMSAYPSEPHHFLDWLKRQGDADADPDGFVSRPTYGRYMGALLDPWSGGERLDCRRAECVGLDIRSDGVTAHLSDGGRIEADLAVLATGHALPDRRKDPELSQPWAGAEGPCHGPVLIVGSGLTMVDQVLSLLAAGHRGPITVMSRHGLLPQVHRQVAPGGWTPEGPPPVGRVSDLMRWLRAEVRRREDQGGDWREVVDGLRPQIQAIWRDMPLAARRSFLRHASPWWEVHRHRMPPSSHEKLDLARASGQLRLVRGRFERASQDTGGGLVAHVRGPDHRPADIRVARIIDCRGIRRDPEAHASPLIASLLASGEAFIDPLRLGLDVGPDCDVLRPDGSRSERLFAMGPVSRAAFWEITAIPDIRLQAERLARRLLDAVLT
ncbi:FAD/NAD(P)-binding protein [Rubellimicrobium arenae]|uniref:FAD/NAD(P)-binding protein n=1 Tax=Rubellimicrobium arenae TaxID=2817372 RepID=UPI001FED48B4|nr:FAD/NAD(P)-binding protein [Rubellimicrobium arenae]